MAPTVQTAARRFILSSKHRVSHLPRVANAAAKTSPVSSCAHGLSQDLKSGLGSSSRRLRGAFGMGESLMPWHSATAAASLVSRLCNDDTPLEGRLEGYVSPI